MPNRVTISFIIKPKESDGCHDLKETAINCNDFQLFLLMKMIKELIFDTWYVIFLGECKHIVKEKW